MSRSRTRLRRLPTGFCKYASVPTLGCDVFLHAALSWIGQRGNWLTKLIQCVIQQCNITYRELNFLVFLPHQFAMVEVMVTSLMDEFYQQLIAFFKRKEFFVLAVCGVAFLLGIPCVLQVNSISFDWLLETMWTLVSSFYFCLGGHLCFSTDGPLHCHSLYHVFSIFWGHGHMLELW